MQRIKQHWFLFIIISFFIVVPLWSFWPSWTESPKKDPWRTVIKQRAHLDHKPFFTNEFTRPQDVTLACLQCHPKAAKDLMKTVHWKWESEPVLVPGHAEPMPIGKKNLLNNFCIGIGGNWATCTSCHAGYGWSDANFDFSKEENVDCLVCHDWSGTYAKGSKGMPKEGVKLLLVAQSVGYPKRDNCARCHFSGGGGMGVKHGDLDDSLLNPSESVDVHMGKHGFLCIDCHKSPNHNISGKSYSVSVTHDNGIGCTDCHDENPHKKKRLNYHVASVACETCHIPLYARRFKTKMEWDWSKVGDSSRKEDVYTYLKKKGEFVYSKNIVPEYEWFNLKSYRYILKDKIDPKEVVYINKPMGDISDKTAKIWPFKIHRARQPYDKEHQYLLPVVVSGEGGLWHEYNWDKALRLGSEVAGIPFSGQYDFANTHMYWSLSHMIAPRPEALKCKDCHSENSRLNWKDLGYPGDPEKFGDRKHIGKLKE